VTDPGGEVAEERRWTTTDCAQHPHIDETDELEHARWHAEQAAHLDTTQGSMFR
jgi:hypothetical protein